MLVEKKINIEELKKEMLKSILSVKGIIYTHYKNKQKGNNEIRKTRQQSLYVLHNR